MEKMKTLAELLDQLNRLNRDILAVEKASGYLDGNDDLSALSFKASDPDVLFRWNEARAVMESLDAARLRLSYMALPIVETGRLRLNLGTERLYFPSGMELHCGTIIEVLIEDDGYSDHPYWYAGRIEHDEERFYITGNRRVPLEGIMARRRERK